MLNPLVSIIIPTYNRAHLIGETLDSIIAQTYSNWECIIVDDGSMDTTEQLIEGYMVNDSRFQYHQRPDTHLPGGNGARNYGFKLSKGDYIQWFDSDDLMVPKKLELEAKALTENDVDFVVSKTKYFNTKNNSFFNYDFEVSDVTFESYAIDYIRWHTPDLMVKRSVIKTIQFNEIMSAGQEHNFNCKLLLKTNNLYYLDTFLTLRRYTPSSIQGQRDQSAEIHLKKMFETHWHNYIDIKERANSSKFNRYSLLQCVHCYLELKNEIGLPNGFMKELKEAFPKRYYFFYVAKFTNSAFGKYYKFYELMKQNEVFNTYHLKQENQ
ncbi:glycosyltransferase family 2 protein [Gelidibacter maritimus]|uniref:Glycosyltransferase family 2 protein n=1 Tax=Gelidibacter maritimus TaxID=2761487 RepID=A0A7W2M584_9FLAO|nr:glycosyltransferase family 2 protein [Gelidibacter maritimus]MBA6152691.1 glycosyltransferase family 2 protein [Gelidibacter maritimus]